MIILKLIGKIAPYIFVGLIIFILGVRVIYRNKRIPKKILIFLDYLD